MKIKLNIMHNEGSLLQKYPGQSDYQDRYIELHRNGDVVIDYDGEIGSGVPPEVYHNLVLRIYGDWETYADAKYWIKQSRNDLEKIISGMGERWDGSNYIGTLTDEADVIFNRLQNEFEQY